MPREIPESECNARQQAVDDLDAGRGNLWAELSDVWDVYVDANLQHADAREIYMAASIEFRTAEHLHFQARAQLERCRERGTSDCAEEEALDTAAWEDVQRTAQPFLDAYGHYQELGNRVEMLRGQFRTVLASISENAERQRDHEQAMKDGHCHRFKKP